MKSSKPPAAPPGAPRERQATRLSLPDFEPEDVFTQPWDVSAFEDIGPLFALLEATGTFRPGGLESQYATLFFEALGEGEIGDLERERLNLAADALGIEVERRALLEEGWRRAYQGGVFSPKSPLIEDDNAVVETSSLPLSRLLARAPTPAPAPRPLDSVDPRVHDLSMLFDQAAQRGDTDAQVRISSVLATKRGARSVPGFDDATDARRRQQVGKPLRSLGEDTWAALSDPSEVFLLASSIFREVATPGLLARASAFRLDGKRAVGAAENLATTKLAPVRAFAWCAAHLGLPCPTIHVDRGAVKGLEFVPTLPPTVVIGAPLLEADPFEVAFECARHLSLHRPEHFVTLLVPDVTSLEDLFHAALLLIVSDLPIERDAMPRALLNRDAIRHAVDAEAMERLRHLVRTQLLLGLPRLGEWLEVVERTADRVGLLLAGSFETALTVLEREGASLERVTHLENFWVSRLAGSIRRELGTAVA